MPAMPKASLYVKFFNAAAWASVARPGQCHGRWPLYREEEALPTAIGMP